jgi:hypothetical protein
MAQIEMGQSIRMFLSMGKKMKDFEPLGQIIHLQAIITVKASLDIWEQGFQLL